MRMSYLTLLAVVSLHVVKCDDMYMATLIRRIRFVRKEKHAGFEETITRKIRAARGEVALLTCLVKNIFNESVSWIRGRDLHILTVEDDVYTGDRRFQILVSAPTNWTLKINNVQPEDSGLYECQINTQPVLVLPVYLTVYDPVSVVSPIEHFLDYGMDIVEETNADAVVSDEVIVELSKYAPADNGNAKILEGSEIIVQEGATLNITCDVFVGRNRAPDFASTLHPSDAIRNLSLVWLHNNQVMNESTCHDGTSIRTKNSSRLIRSRLLILNVALSDSGDYVCRPLKFDKEAVIKVEVVSGVLIMVPSIRLLIVALVNASLTRLKIFQVEFCNDFL